MPTYGYRCEKNGHEFEVVQSFADPPLTRCKICGSKVNRIFYPVGIVFKGPGFYATDNRAGSKTPTFGDKSEGEGKSDSAEAKPVKSDSKPKAKDKDKGDSKPKSGSATKN
jgi:putative FmdB family regulatory protein